jgi:predicted nucleotidyltransferase
MKKMMKFKLEKDFLDFIKLCNEHNVRYLVIGGYAVGVHGYPRYTKDIDIAVEVTEENATKTALVIQDFGFASLGLTKEDFLRKNFVTQLKHEPLRIDILNDVEGVSFQQAWKNRSVVEYEGVLINFVGLDELLILKTIAGRTQDKADIEKLKARNKKK